MHNRNPTDPGSRGHQGNLATSYDRGNWITYKRRNSATKLEEVPFDEIPALVRREAAVQAR